MRMIRVLLLALLVGLAIGLFKGNGQALRSEIGNLSAPWLIIPVFAAWRAGGGWRGALVGLAATLTALAGFYAGALWSYPGHHGFTSDPVRGWLFLMRANRVWFVAGIVSGPVMGALAGFAGQRLADAWRWVLAGLVLLGELPVIRAVEGVRLPVLGWGWAVESWSVYGAEAVLGVAVLLIGAVRLRHTPAAAG